jgi:hypothetical protein
MGFWGEGGGLGYPLQTVGMECVKRVAPLCIHHYTPTHNRTTKVPASNASIRTRYSWLRQTLKRTTKVRASKAWIRPRCGSLPNYVGTGYAPAANRLFRLGLARNR